MSIMTGSYVWAGVKARPDDENQDCCICGAPTVRSGVYLEHKGTHSKALKRNSAKPKFYINQIVKVHGVRKIITDVEYQFGEWVYTFEAI